MAAVDDRTTGDFLAVIVRASLVACSGTRSHGRPQLDLNPLAWQKSATPDDRRDSLSLETALETLLIFANAHLCLRSENELAVYGAGLGKRFVVLCTSSFQAETWHSELLYSSIDAATYPDSDDEADDGGAYQQFRFVDNRIAKKAKEMLIDSETSRESAYDSCL